MPPPYAPALTQSLVVSYMRITSPVPTALIRVPGAYRYTPDRAMIRSPHLMYHGPVGLSATVPPAAGSFAAAAAIRAASVTPVTSPDGATVRNGLAPDPNADAIAVIRPVS